ncbi:MAG TPA: EAL domain-containing protein [Frankiaceae bacterium]|nr:EAL domain-containing protein [Frankiaceae bacterium]
MPLRTGAVPVVRARTPNDGASDAGRRLWAEELKRNGLSSLGRNFPGGALLVFDEDLRFLAAGGGGLADVGLTQEMVEGKTITEAFGPELAAQLEAPYRQALAGKDVSVEISLLGRTLRQRLTGVRDTAGLLLGGMGFVQDVTEARAYQRDLLESAERFRLAFDNAPIGKAVVELDGTFRQVNLALCRLTGYDRESLLGLSFQDITHPDDLAADLELLDEVVRGVRSSYEIEKRYRKPSGEYVWTLLSVGIVRSAAGEPLYFISQVQDTSERKSDQLALLDAHNFQDAVFAVSPDTIHVFDVHTNRMLWTSRSMYELLGYAPAEIDTFQRGPSQHIIPEPDFVRFNAAITASCDCSDGEVIEVRHQLRHRDGRLLWVSNRFTPFQRDDAGAVTQLLGVTRDVTDAVAFEERLEHAALHDDLTGLPNRRLINRRLGEALEQARAEPAAAEQREIVVLFCDLDGFKRVNDAHGHQIGDSLLRVSASRLVSATRAGDTVGRMGGDEFVVILAVAADEDPAAVGREVAERVIRAVGEPLVLGAVEHAITASVGICVAQPGTTPHDLVRDADTAMYQAKLNGKAGHALFVPTLREDARSRDALVRNVRQSLADNTLDVHYQPIVDPRTSRVTGVEALVRIPGPDGRLLDTAAAIAAAEQAGLIGAVGERVLRRACEQTARWRQLPEHAELAVAVNLSASEIARPGLYDRVTAIVASTELDPRALTLEITESVLLDAGPTTVQDLRRLHEDGIGIAIDDFGTGYAGLRYLATLPVTAIKVDRSFTAGLPDNAVSATIVRATIGLATELRLACVVEGVETAQQLAALPQAARLLVQGYFFARPQPADAALPAFISPLESSAAAAL